MSYQCLRTDGNGYASIADAPEQGLNMGLSDFMIEVRIKTSFSGARQYIIRKWEAGVYYHFRILDSSGYTEYIIADGTNVAVITSDITITDGKWHYIVVVADRSSATGGRIYIDGVEDESARTNLTSVENIDNAGTVYLGSYDSVPRELLIGLLDEVRVWNFGYGGLPADYEAYIAWRAAGRNVFLDIGQYNGGAWNVYADAYREEKVTDGNMEAVDSWVDNGTPTTNERSNDQAHADTYSRKIVTDAVWEGCKQEIIISASEYYMVGCWYYLSDVAKEGHLAIKKGSDNSTFAEISPLSGTANNWHYAEIVFQVPAGETFVTIVLSNQNDAAVNTLYFDDISIKRVGLVAHYKFDGTYDDETTNANHLTAGGTGSVFPGYTLKKTKIISPFWIK